MDDDSNCEADIIRFPNGKTMGGQTALAIYAIMLREEFVKMNELTGTITFSFGIQTRASDKYIVDSLEGTFFWGMITSLPQTVVQFHKGLIKVNTKQIFVLEGSIAVVEHKD
jgi:hypothetical protein